MSSFVRTIFENGVTGPTGPTGPQGSRGPRGTDGSNVFGSTGSSIIGISFASLSNTHQLIFQYEDGITESSNSFNSGITGLWCVQFGASANNNQFISSFSRDPRIISGNPLQTASDSLVLKTIHTQTPNKIDIERVDDDLISIKYIGSITATLSAENQNQIVIAVAGDAFDGATNSNWNATDSTLDWTISRYLEKPKSLNPVDGGYTINPKDGSIFCLNDSDSILDSTIMISGNSSVSESNSLILIIPRTTTATGDFRIQNSANKPANIPLVLPKPKEGMNVYVGLSVLGEWYFNCAMHGSETSRNLNQVLGSFDANEALQELLGTCWKKTDDWENWVECAYFDDPPDGQIDASDLTVLLGRWNADFSFSLYPVCTTLRGPSFERSCIPTD